MLRKILPFSPLPVSFQKMTLERGKECTKCIQVAHLWLAIWPYPILSAGLLWKARLSCRTCSTLIYLCLCFQPRVFLLTLCSLLHNVKSSSSTFQKQCLIRELSSLGKKERKNYNKRDWMNEFLQSESEVWCRLISWGCADWHQTEGEFMSVSRCFQKKQCHRLKEGEKRKAICFPSMPSHQAAGWDERPNSLEC